VIGLSNVFRSARALLPKQHIFLLSHMRAYTSLFGHIMGSNPAICGYYEMHIGYYSWKSLVRQKLLYFKSEDIKPGFSTMFDKILHDDHYISDRILNDRHCRVIFCLREPQQTIPSILKLYADLDPSHEFNQVAFATDYYVNRLTSLDRLSILLRREFFYFDAESLKDDTDNCLASLSAWLDLDTPLSANYRLQKNTSRRRYGDTSGLLEAGHVIREPAAHGGRDLDPDSMGRAYQTYETVRRRLIERSARRSVRDL